MRFFRSSYFRSARQQGSANMAIVIGLSGAALFLGSKILERGSKMIGNARLEIGQAEATVEAQKILASAGFMIANNLVVCKEDGLGGGRFCDVAHLDGEGDAFEAKDFGIVGKKFETKGISLKIDPKAVISGTNSSLKMEEAILTFHMVDASESDQLRAWVGDRPEEIEAIDKDDIFIRAGVQLTYSKGKSSRKIRSASYYRRPIAIVTTKVRSDPVCPSQCRTSQSQNPFPTCRSVQGVDELTTVDVEVSTVNNGPGVVYDLVYEREVCFRSSLSDRSCRSEAADADGSNKVATVALGTFLPVRKGVLWVDQVSCKSFSAVTRDTSQDRAAQHVTDAGSITYTLDASEDSPSNLEPFRMNFPIDAASDKLPGVNNMVYIRPPH